jgi:hypothetical protein
MQGEVADAPKVSTLLRVDDRLIRVRVLGYRFGVKPPGPTQFFEDGSFRVPQRHILDYTSGVGNEVWVGPEQFLPSWFSCCYPYYPIRSLSSGSLLCSEKSAILSQSC